jgi:Bacterial regulatory helix-turn-helix protein, lysR family
MADIDLNLLTALDALLATGSVAGAARKLGLSASAMSRTLARLRSATGDPLLVRAGRGLVPTDMVQPISPISGGGNVVDRLVPVGGENDQQGVLAQSVSDWTEASLIDP